MVKAKDIRAKSIPDLVEQLGESKEELFRLRFQQATHQLDDPSQLRSLRRDIARIHTVISEKSRLEGFDAQPAEQAENAGDTPDEGADG